ncbi:pk-1 protein [Thysanoplusia orichalcea nucleopolyhedrovirus]|uniref:Pk-1 protein n=1 Tax=Thysanoplusia orichalcea nucleopolyhedrovirus TaxID=101850 RepID=L0CL38_9ABAC|nr:pk-1 protein [Thysanoplusia orichalcea nucleopolyhedrovirus]AGA16165.1 pk-1 protein [Thysanoplusia orichalcea nucleopolyhedrovirus]
MANVALERLVQFYENCKNVKPRYKIINGRFGKISVLSHKPTSKMYLQKTIAAHNFNSDEIKVHQLMNEHPNYIKMYFNYGTLNSQIIVMDYINCPDLFETLQIKGELPYKLVSNIIRQLCEALNDLHKYGFIHNDIKLENVLYFEALDRVYICDYGLCKHENSISVHDGTLEYFSPEKIRHHNYARSFDWYAVGVLTYKLLTGGRHPFEKNEDEMIDLNNMKRRQQYNDISVLKHVRNVNARDFVYCLTRYNIDCRLINYKQIVKHEFLV